MARCQCQGSSCSCQILGGTGVQVEGVGSANQPYRLTAVPNVYSATFTSASPPYYINATFQSEVEARSLFLFEIDPGVTAQVNLPDGSSSYPRPVPGAAIEVIARGTLGGSSGISFGGAVITWFGPGPTTSTLGLYRFVWTGETFAGTWTPYR